MHYSSVFGGQFTWISEDGRPERKNKVVLSNLSDVVWKGLSAGTLLLVNNLLLTLVSFDWFIKMHVLV